MRRISTLLVLLVSAVILTLIAIWDMMAERRLMQAQLDLNTLIERTNEESLSLVSDLGYGGVIHNFKNYVLRGETRYLHATHTAAESALDHVAALHDLAQRQGVQLSFDNTSEMITTYQTRLLEALELREAGLNAEEIDSRVIYDDAPALSEIRQNRALIIDALNASKMEFAAASQQKTYLSFALLFLCVGASLILILSARGFHHAENLKTEHGLTVDALNANMALNEQLKDANTRLEQYSALVAHDIKSPFRQISMLSHMADMKMDGAHPAKPLLSKIHECTQQAQAIIESFLGLAQLNHPFNSIETFELSEAFDYAQRNCRYQTEDGFILHVGQLGEVQGDRRLINQLAINLINNAVKYARPKVRPEITVTSEVDSDFLKVQVKDNGLGISPVHIKSVFEPLYRAPTAHKTAKGTGLGLAICKTIVEAHCGEISVTSKALNQGSTFTFSLPLAHSDVLDSAENAQSTDDDLQEDEVNLRLSSAR